MNKYLFGFGALFIISCSQINQSNEKDTADLVVLKSNLGTAFSIQRENKKVLYKYCPDNTCTVLVSNRNNLINLDRFTLLYFYYASGYVYLNMGKNDGSFIDKSKKHAQDIIFIESICSGKEHQVASCVMSRLLDSGITGYKVRFDENRENRTIINLNEKIDVEHLLGIVKWREKKT